MLERPRTVPWSQRDLVVMLVIDIHRAAKDQSCWFSHHSQNIQVQVELRSGRPLPYLIRLWSYSAFCSSWFDIFNATVHSLSNQKVLKTALGSPTPKSWTWWSSWVPLNCDAVLQDLITWTEIRKLKEIQEEKTRRLGKTRNSAARVKRMQILLFHFRLPDFFLYFLLFPLSYLINTVFSLVLFHIMVL